MREELLNLKHGEYYTDGLVEIWYVHNAYILFDIIRDGERHHFNTYSKNQFESMIFDINKLT